MEFPTSTPTTNNKVLFCLNVNGVTLTIFATF